MDRDTGSLTLIIGPMFASKTSHLISIVNRKRSIQKPVMVITNRKDSRYGKNILASHDGTKIKAKPLERLMDIFDIETYPLHDDIVIEEGQFFPDLFRSVIKLVDEDKKNVIVCGLSGDYKREQFGEILRLIPHAEDIIQLYAFCSLCGELKKEVRAPFTKRISKEDTQELVGGSEYYIPVCRYHYIH